jgi:type III pantothenate kinase
MVEKKYVLAIDAGNTSMKIGVYENDQLINKQTFNLNEETAIKLVYHELGNPPVVIASVRNKQDTAQLVSWFENCLLVDQNTPLPLKTNYKTTETLGIDRVCNAIAINQLAPNKNAISIDIGTCVKFDFVDKHNTYQGGSISPGIRLRYASLHEHTANLPLLEETGKVALSGKSTKECMHSGVIHGIRAEIIGMMEQYSEELGDLTIFMTGGDVHYFDFPRKNNIFVVENLTLNGLFQIYSSYAK